MIRPSGAPPPNALGGLDLSALASQGQAETQTRVAGQASLMDGYLSATLGEAKGRNLSASDRERQLLAFRRQQALMDEEIERQRLGSAASGQRERIAAAASEAQTQRDFDAARAMEDRAFELGQVAATRADQTDPNSLDERRFKLEQERFLAEYGDGSRPEWGKDAVDFDRGQYLSGRDIGSDIRGRSFGPSQGSQIADLPDWARDKAQAALESGDLKLPQGPTFEEQKGEARKIVLKHGPVSANPDPAEFQRRILELFNGSSTAASLALSDLGEIANWNAGL